MTTFLARLKIFLSQCRSERAYFWIFPGISRGNPLIHSPIATSRAADVYPVKNIIRCASITPTLIIIHHANSNFRPIRNVPRVFSARRWFGRGSITCAIPGKFSFRRSAWAARYIGIVRARARTRGSMTSIPGCHNSQCLPTSRKVSLKLRLAIQFGPPVNRLQNRFLIGTPCNEQNVRPRFTSPHLTSPRRENGFSCLRLYPPRSFADFRVTHSSTPARQLAKTTASLANAHSVFCFLHARLRFRFPPPPPPFCFREEIDTYIGLVIHARELAGKICALSAAVVENTSSVNFAVIMH